MHYRYLYRDGETLFFEQSGREVRAFLDGVSPSEFDSLTESLSGSFSERLLESLVFFADVSPSALKESANRFADQFSSMKEAYLSEGFSWGFSTAQAVYSGKVVEPLKEGSRACAACGSLAESTECKVCGSPTWKMSGAEAWWYGLKESSEVVLYSVTEEDTLANVLVEGCSAILRLSKDDVDTFKKMESFSEASKLRFIRKRGMLEQSRWSKGFGSFSRRGSRVDPLEESLERVKIEDSPKGSVLCFKESRIRRHISLKESKRFVEAVVTSGMSAVAAKGLTRALEEETVSADIGGPERPVGPYKKKRKKKAVTEAVADKAELFFDDTSDNVVIAKSLEEGKTLADVACVGDSCSLAKRGDFKEVDTFSSKESEELAELAVAVGDTDPQVYEVEGLVLLVFVPLSKCGEEDGLDLTMEEERIMEIADDGGEHLLTPSEEKWTLAEGRKAVLSLERKGLLESFGGAVGFRKKREQGS